MKFTTLSLVAALAVTSAYAGGDIAPVEPVVKEVAVVVPANTAIGCNSLTTINSKATAYYYTDDTVDLFDKDSSAFATAVTLDVSHKITPNIAANFSAVGFVNWIDGDLGYFEGEEKGAFFNVANLTATFGDTSFILGRQLINSPMFGSFDWGLAPSSFEAYTVANGSIDNVTLVGTYVRQFREVNTGDTWIDLTDIGDGNNWAVGAVYGNEALAGNLWYYNIDVADYTQVYADASYDFGNFDVAAQIASTDYAKAKDSLAYGMKVGTEFSGVKLSAAADIISDNKVGFVSKDGLYTTSYNYFASNAAVLNDDTTTWKVAASTKYAGLNAEASYAGYGDEGSELDVILGYDFTKCISAGAVYSLTDYDVDVDTQDAVAALEIFANYKF